MNKILIIGQAPPAVKQQYPYDTTMLYDWFSECGISKQQAQEMFHFEALVDKFPGHGTNGHLKPLDSDIKAHWANVLLPKLKASNKVILLGSVAGDFYDSQPVDWDCKELHIIHPSKRNYALFQKNRHNIISRLKQFIQP